MAKQRHWWLNYYRDVVMIRARSKKCRYIPNRYKTWRKEARQMKIETQSRANQEVHIDVANSKLDTLVHEHDSRSDAGC